MKPEIISSLLGTLISAIATIIAALIQNNSKNENKLQSSLIVPQGYKEHHVTKKRNLWNFVVLFAIAGGIVGYLIGALINSNNSGAPETINQTKSFDSFELIIELPGINASNTALSNDYDTIVNILSSGQVDTDITISVGFLTAKFPFQETLYFTSALHELRVYILPYDSENWNPPPTWQSYTINWNEKFRSPVLLSRNQNGKISLSIQAERNDLAQLSSEEISMASIEDWDIELAITWSGSNANEIYSMMDSGNQMEWILELPAIIKINGVETWRGTLSQASSRVTTSMPYKVNRDGSDVWEFTKHYGTNPQPSNNGK